MKASCRGWSLPSSASPSMVMISRRRLRGEHQAGVDRPRPRAPCRRRSRRCRSPPWCRSGPGRRAPPPAGYDAARLRARRARRSPAGAGVAWALVSPLMVPSGLAPGEGLAFRTSPTPCSSEGQPLGWLCLDCHRQASGEAKASPLRFGERARSTARRRQRAVITSTRWRRKAAEPRTSEIGLGGVHGQLALPSGRPLPRTAARPGRPRPPAPAQGWGPRPPGRCAPPGSGRAPAPGSPGLPPRRQRCPPQRGGYAAVAGAGPRRQGPGCGDPTRISSRPRTVWPGPVKNCSSGT